MHVTDLDDQSSPLAASSVPPFHPRSGKTSFLRLARLAADLGNGINQRAPRRLLNNPVFDAGWGLCGVRRLNSVRFWFWDGRGL
jgi:hypothetical protein